MTGLCRRVDEQRGTKALKDGRNSPAVANIQFVMGAKPG